MNKLGSILLSVIVAFGLWYYVITSVSPGSSATIYDIPVVIDGESVLNEERGLMVTYVSADKVNMRLSGNRSDLQKVNKGNITLRADLSRIYEPGNMISVAYSTTFPGDVPSNAFVTEFKNPDRLYVTVVRRITKEVPVEVYWVGSAPEGYLSDRENRVLDYPFVQVTGPESVVDTIEKATIEVDLSEQRESLSADFQYTLCDANNEPVDAELIVTNVEKIHLDVKIQRVKNIQLVYTLVEGGGASRENADIVLSIESIRVAGSAAVLENLGDSMVVGTINLGDITQSTDLIFPVTLPDTVMNLTGVTEVMATIQLKGLETKELEIDNIQAANVPEGMTAEVITEKMLILVRGPADKIAAITPENVSVAVDFTSAEPGTSTYKAVVTMGEGFQDVGILRADAISASLQQK